MFRAMLWIQEHGNYQHYQINLVSCLSKRLLYLRLLRFFFHLLLPPYGIFVTLKSDHPHWLGFPDPDLHSHRDKKVNPH